MGIKRFSLSIILTFILATACYGAPLKVGVLFPMSGEFAEQGRHSLNGIKLSDSKNLELIFEDAGSTSGALLASAVKNLIEQKKVNVILGPGLVPQAMVVASIANSRGVPVITSALCSPELLKYKNLVCGYPSTKDQLVDLKKIISKFQIKTLAFVSDSSQYGTEVGEILNSMSKDGLFRLSQTIEIGEASDAERAVATKVGSVNSDGIFTTTQSTAISLNLFRRLSEQGYKGVRIGFLDVDNSMLKGFSATLKGVLLPGYVTSNYTQGFSLAYEAKYGEKPDMYAAIAHDMLATLNAALRKTSDTVNLIPFLTEATPEEPALKGFHFNSDRTINLPLDVLEIGDESLAPVQF